MLVPSFSHEILFVRFRSSLWFLKSYFLSQFWAAKLKLLSKMGSVVKNPITGINLLFASLPKLLKTTEPHQDNGHFIIVLQSSMIHGLDQGQSGVFHWFSDSIRISGDYRTQSGQWAVSLSSCGSSVNCRLDHGQLDVFLYVVIASINIPKALCSMYFIRIK